MTPPDDDRLPDETAEMPGETASLDVGGYVGSTIAGRYEVVERLGSGAMGTVYLAEHTRMGRHDAIKVLSPEMVGDEEARARFTREARNASRLNHPNVCTVYDFGRTDDDLPFIAMEYVEGETLTDLLEREGRLPPARAAELTVQVTRGLEAAHARDIVHRDLKPENVMLTRDDTGAETVKVVDFGIAKAIQDDDDRQNVTRAGYVVGTPRYVSPEQVQGGELDGRSDIYSLGIVLYQMLTGELPFTGETWQEVMTRRLSEDPRPLEEAAPEARFPAALEEVVLTALEREPGDRYQDAAELREALQAAVRDASGDTVPATRAVSAGEAGPSAESRGDLPWTKIAYGGLALLLLGGGAVTAGAVLGGGDAASPAGEETQIAAGPGAAGSTSEEGATDDRPAGGTERDEGGAAPAGTEGGDAATGETAAGTAEPGTGGRERDAAAGADASGGGGNGDARSGPALSAARADSMLNRQLIAVDEASGPARLAAAADTAELAWDAEELPDRQRAYAAYILGNIRLEENSRADACSWLERAMGLDPDGPGYRSLRDEVCRDGP